MLSNLESLIKISYLFVSCTVTVPVAYAFKVLLNLLSIAIFPMAMTLICLLLISSSVNDNINF